MIKVQVNDPVIEIKSPHRTGVIKQITLSPNSVDDSSLIAVIRVMFDGGGEIVANSDKFETVGGYKYSEFNPSQR